MSTNDNSENKKPYGKWILWTVIGIAALVITMMAFGQ